MIGHARTAVKFFVYGLVVGLLFAPKKGEETRKDAMAWITSTVQQLMGTVSGAASSAVESASSSVSSAAESAPGSAPGSKASTPPSSASSSAPSGSV